MAKCGMSTYKGYTFFLPQCMGGAVRGIDGCTCRPYSESDKIKELEKRIEKLESIINGKTLQ